MREQVSLEGLVVILRERHDETPSQAEAPTSPHHCLVLPGKQRSRLDEPFVALLSPSNMCAFLPEIQQTEHVLLHEFLGEISLSRNGVSLLFLVAIGNRELCL